MSEFTLSFLSVTLPQLFVQGGLFTMSLITILLVCLRFAAWKAPAWVKEIGIATLVVGLISVAFGWYNAASALEMTNGEIAPSLLWGGIKCHMVILIYALLVYLVSLIIRIVHKPRLL